MYPQTNLHKIDILSLKNIWKHIDVNNKISIVLINVEHSVDFSGHQDFLKRLLILIHRFAIACLKLMSHSLDKLAKS